MVQTLSSMEQKITHWLLITLVLSLGFGQLLRLEYLGIPLYLHDVLVICLLALQVPILVKNYKERIFVIPQGLKLFILALVLSGVYSLTLYPLAALYIPALYTLRLLSYIALFMCLKIQKIKFPTSIFMISGLVTIFIGLIQYIFLPDMRIFANLGWDDHLARLTMPHFDPTFTGVMIGLFALSMLGLTTVFTIPILLLSTLAILLTYARSVWLALLIIGFIYIKNQKLLLLFLVSLIIGVFILPQSFGEGTNLLRTYSITSRAESDMRYIKKYNWGLIIGRGMNTLILDSPATELENHATGPNNSYLYLLLTSGILGLVGWSMFMYSIYKQSIHKSMVMFLFLASIFNNVMFYPFALLWILLFESTIYDLPSTI